MHEQGRDAVGEVAKIMNTSVSPKTGFTPQEMVFGSINKNNSFLSLENWTQPHYLVRSNKQRIEDLTSTYRYPTVLVIGLALNLIK